MAIATKSLEARLTTQTKSARGVVRNLLIADARGESIKMNELEHALSAGGITPLEASEMLVVVKQRFAAAQRLAEADGMTAEIERLRVEARKAQEKFAEAEAELPKKLDELHKAQRLAIEAMRETFGRQSAIEREATQVLQRTTSTSKDDAAALDPESFDLDSLAPTPAKPARQTFEDEDE